MFAHGLQLQEYYTVHGKDAVFVANELFRSTSVIKEFRSRDTTLQYVVVNKTRFEAFVRELLLVRQFRVEVYREKHKGDNSWEVLYKVPIWAGNVGYLGQLLTLAST